MKILLQNNTIIYNECTWERDDCGEVGDEDVFPWQFSRRGGGECGVHAAALPRLALSDTRFDVLTMRTFHTFNCITWNINQKAYLLKITIHT